MPTNELNNRFPFRFKTGDDGWADDFCRVLDQLAIDVPSYGLLRNRPPANRPYTPQFYIAIDSPKQPELYARYSGEWRHVPTDGPEGPAGDTIHYGSGDPPANLGSNGDTYIDTQSYDLYGPKSNGAWPEGNTLVGPRGPQGSVGPRGNEGPQGPEGPAGDTVHYGTGAPDNSFGNNGDSYIDTNTHDLYGPKANRIWPEPISLVGPPANVDGDLIKPRQIGTAEQPVTEEHVAKSQVGELSVNGNGPVTGITYDSGELVPLYSIGLGISPTVTNTDWSLAGMDARNTPLIPINTLPATGFSAYYIRFSSRVGNDSGGTTSARLRNYPTAEITYTGSGKSAAAISPKVSIDSSRDIIDAPYIEAKVDGGTGNVWGVTLEILGEVA